MRMQVVDRSGEVLRIEPFSVETAATVFEPRPVAVVAATAVTDFLLDDMEMLAHRTDALPEINRYLASAGLYPVPGELSTAGTLLGLSAHSIKKAPPRYNPGRRCLSAKLKALECLMAILIWLCLLRDAL